MDTAVLGGGHGCFAAVAELAGNGHRVRWWRREMSALDPVRKRGALEVRDHRGRRQVPVADADRAGAVRPVADLAEALSGAELVVVPLPATAHPDLAARVAPLLSDGQIVFLPPGTFGTVAHRPVARPDQGHIRRGDPRRPHRL
jgi:opine dehydrogenase